VGYRRGKHTITKTGKERNHERQNLSGYRKYIAELEAIICKLVNMGYKHSCEFHDSVGEDINEILHRQYYQERKAINELEES
jgi:hypothetical protein